MKRISPNHYIDKNNGHVRLRSIKNPVHFIRIKNSKNLYKIKKIKKKKIQKKEFKFHTDWIRGFDAIEDLGTFNLHVKLFSNFKPSLNLFLI